MPSRIRSNCYTISLFNNPTFEKNYRINTFARNSMVDGAVNLKKRDFTLNLPSVISFSSLIKLNCLLLRVLSTVLPGAIVGDTSPSILARKTTKSFAFSTYLVTHC